MFGSGKVTGWARWALVLALVALLAGLPALGALAEEELEQQTEAVQQETRHGQEEEGPSAAPQDDRVGLCDGAVVTQDESEEESQEEEEEPQEESQEEPQAEPEGEPEEAVTQDEPADGETTSGTADEEAATETEQQSEQSPEAETEETLEPEQTSELEAQSDPDESEPVIVIVELMPEAEDEAEPEQTPDAADAHVLSESDFEINVLQPTLQVAEADNQYRLEGGLLVRLTIKNNAPTAAQVELAPKMSESARAAYQALGLALTQGPEPQLLASGETAEFTFSFDRAEAMTIDKAALEALLAQNALYFPVGIVMVAA